jgi:hypothetical protein
MRVEAMLDARPALDSVSRLKIGYGGQTLTIVALPKMNHDLLNVGLQVRIAVGELTQAHIDGVNPRVGEPYVELTERVWGEKCTGATRNDPHLPEIVD